MFPLHSLSLSSDISWLDEIFDERISPDIMCVGLGEFTHGGHETMAFKSKMIQYLVSKKGYRRIIIEYPNVLLRNLNSYLLDVSVKDTLVAGQKVKDTFGYNLNDMSSIELIQWLKIYNLDHHNQPISFVGIDIEGSLTTFADYFNENFVPLIDSAQELGFPRKFTSDERHSVSIAQLQWLNKNKDYIKNKVDSIKYQELIYNAKAARDKLNHISKQDDNEYVASAFRDSIMADNVLAQTSAKAMLWSHNIHATTSDFVVNLGNYLQPKLGK